MSDTPRTDEAIERWRQGKVNILEEMAKLETDLNFAEAERIDMAKQLRSEKEAHAACQNERDNLQDQRDLALRMAKEREKERDEARRKVAELQAGLDDIEEYGTEEINAAVDLRHQLGAALVERDKAISVAENLIEYAHECLAKLESWGQGYKRYEDDMDRIREDIAAYNMMKEAQETKPHHWEDRALTAERERDEAREEAERLRESLRCLLNPQCAVEEAAK